MDQLPDIRSDADVDALMARLRAKLPVASAPSQGPASPVERSGNALRDFLAVQEEHAAVMLHALRLVADTLEELQDEAEGASVPRTRSAEPRANAVSVAAAAKARDDRPRPAGRGGGAAPRINGRRRKAR